MHIKILTFFFIGFSLLTNAQKFTNSPFSSYGIGEFGGLDHAIFSGMGNASIALIDTTILNFNNPSSYASLGKGQPLFSTGISSRFSAFKEGNGTSDAKYIGLDHFALAIPFGKYFGLAAGLKPFSRTGYEFSETATAGTTAMKYLYKGSGGTHQVFGGFSANVLNIKRDRLVGTTKVTSYHRLGLGVNISYIFGSTENERISYIDQSYSVSDNIAGGIENKGYTIKSIHTDFGLNYSWTIDKRRSLVIGAIYTPSQKLTARQNYLLAYSVNVFDSEQFQLLDTAVSDKGHIIMPSVLGAGFSYTMTSANKQNKTKIYQLMFTGDFKTTDWSNYQSRFNGINATENFKNTISIHAGVQFTPHHDYRDRTNTIGYINRIRYRAGFQFATLPLVVEGTQQSNVAVTAGIGLPFAIQRASSSLNFGITAGKQGNGIATSLNERYIGINFGVTISPGASDRWFRKFKID